ncbi:MAG: YcbK family protein [Deltaproteobacteria bacterium]|nr:YcbK family protein [Deltaproteobacteria bacterium]
MNLRQLSILAFFGAAFLLAYGFAMPAGHGFRDMRGDGLLTLHNTHLNETVTVQYRNPNGSYNRKGLKEINHALRCRQTNKERKIRVDLLEMVDQIQDHFGAKEVAVISGYRSKQLNEYLWLIGRRVSRNSPHMYGQAMDVRLPGVTTADLRDYADRLNRKGGVGYYPSNQFVHVDVGMKRRW